MTRVGRVGRSALLATLVAGGGILGAAGSDVTTAVYAQIGNGYHRTKLPNGRYQPEYYAIANGGMIPGTTRDRTVDRVPYPRMAGITAEYLARQNYFLAKDRKQARLLIVLHWGTTIPFSGENYQEAINTAGTALAEMQALGGGGGATLGAGAGPFGTTENAAAAASESEFEMMMLRLLLENDRRDQASLFNARLLGYVREINEHNTIKRFAGGGHYFNDLREDIEESRYYVIISAYDFREATERNTLKLLWVTRVSVRSPGNSFDGQLETMLAKAHRHFGRESGKLLREFVPEGRVEIGETEIIGVAPETVRAENPRTKQ